MHPLMKKTPIMGKDKTYTNVKRILIATAIGIAIAVILTSCSSIRKLKKNVKQTEQVKTTEQTNKAKDSSVTTITKEINSDGATVTVVFENDGKDTATNVEITTYPPHKEDYFFKPQTVSVKTNRKPKSITVNQAKKLQQIKEALASLKTIETKAATTEKKTTTQTKQVEKQKFVFHWWWLLILLAVVLLFLWLHYNLTPATAVGWLRKQFTNKKSI